MHACIVFSTTFCICAVCFSCVFSFELKFVPFLCSETDDLRLTMENIQIRGKNCPKPVKTWAQSGVSLKILDVLKKYLTSEFVLGLKIVQTE